MGRFGSRGDGLRWRLRASREIWIDGRTPEGSGPRGVPIPGGRVDRPEADAALPPHPVTFEGWAMFASGPAARVELWLGEEALGPARLGLPRPDIHTADGQPRGLAAGWAHTVDLGDRPAASGRVTLRALATGLEGERLELDPVPLRVLSPEPPATVEVGRDSPAPETPSPGGRRVLVFTHQLDLGGAQTFLVQMLRGLLRLGVVEPTVLAVASGPLQQELEDLGIPVHISTAAPIDDLQAHRGRVAELTAWAAQGDFELVLVNTATALAFPGAEVAASLGIPAVWIIHESFPPPILWQDLDPGVRALGESALAEAAAAVFEAEATQRLYEGAIPPDRCLTLPYGLDIEPIDRIRDGFDRDDARRRAGIAADAVAILCVGTIEPRKAQVSLAQAFDLVSPRHPDARLVFLGGRENPDTFFLEEWISSLPGGERIEVLPMTPEPQPWYGTCDLLVCASDVESLPRAVLEAMAWELPVLATEVFGLPELIDDGRTGWLCAPRDVQALADGLDRVLGTPKAARREIGLAGRRLVEKRHSIVAYCEDFAGLLERLTGEAVASPEARLRRPGEASYQ